VKDWIKDIREVEINMHGIINPRGAGPTL